MADLYNRSWRLIVGSPGGDGLDVSDLRFVFSISKTISSEPNTLDLEVYNLGPESRQRLSGAEGPQEIILELGYQDDLEIAFQGQATRIWNQRQGPDWITRIEVADGAEAIQQTRVSRSFEDGISVGQIINKIAEDLGVTVGEIQGAISEEFANGFSVDGFAKTVMDKLSKFLAGDWSIQDGELQIIERGQASQEERVVLTPRTGLLGSPTITDEGVDFVALINPKVRPGRQIEIADTIQIPDGVFKVDNVDLNGDTRGTQWEMKGQAVEL